MKSSNLPHLFFVLILFIVLDFVVLGLRIVLKIVVVLSEKRPEKRHGCDRAEHLRQDAAGVSVDGAAAGAAGVGAAGAGAVAAGAAGLAGAVPG